MGTAGPSALLDSVRRLDDGSIAIADIALHRPTLDDVFLSLTGHVAEADKDAEDAESETSGPGGRTADHSPAPGVRPSLSVAL